jgi:hypothetical protein
MAGSFLNADFMPTTDAFSTATVLLHVAQILGTQVGTTENTFKVDSPVWQFLLPVWILSQPSAFGILLNKNESGLFLGPKVFNRARLFVNVKGVVYDSEKLSSQWVRYPQCTISAFFCPLGG